MKLNLLLLTVFLLLAGCHHKEGLVATDRAVAQFHEQYNNREFEKIFDESGVEFKAVYDKEKVIASFEKIRARLGGVENTNRIGWAVDVEPIGLEVVANFETGFEKGKAKERFGFLVYKGKAELMNYEFDSESVDLE